MNTMNRLARSVRITLLAGLVAVAAALGSAVFHVGEAFAQNVPGAPTGVTTQGTGGKNAYGDKEMRVVWDAPAAGNCAVTDYFVRVYKTSDQSIPEQSYTPHTAYVFTKLEPSTAYDVEVWTYSRSCNNYSTTPGTHSRSTNSTNHANDPRPADNQPRMASNPPGMVSVSKSGTSVTANWSAPTVDASRCPHTDYSLRLDNRTTTNDSDDVDVIGTTSTSQTFTGLTTGHRYLIQVWSYSDHPCDQNSAGANIWFTQ